MKILTWSIINNEIDYLKDIIPYHLSWVDGMYFLDTGSTDGSFEFLQEQSKLFSNIFVDKYSISYTPDYSLEWEKMKNPFPEADVRNFALSKAEKLNSDWLVQLDGDEVFLKNTKKLIDDAAINNYNILSLSTINPVESLKNHPIELRKNRKNNNSVVKLYDPHARIWRSSLKVRYIKNPALSQLNQFHCIPALNGKHVYHYKNNVFLEDIVHFHLHWMYGKKMEMFFNRKNIFAKKDMITDQKSNVYSVAVPKIFWDRRKEWNKL